MSPDPSLVGNDARLSKTAAVKLIFLSTPAVLEQVGGGQKMFSVIPFFCLTAHRMCLCQCLLSLSPFNIGEHTECIACTHQVFSGVPLSFADSNSWAYYYYITIHFQITSLLWPWHCPLETIQHHSSGMEIALKHNTKSIRVMLTMLRFQNTYFFKIKMHHIPLLKF